MHVSEDNDKPNLIEGATLCTYKRKLILYGGLGIGLSSDIYVFNPFDSSSYTFLANQGFGEIRCFKDIQNDKLVYFNLVLFDKI